MKITKKYVKYKKYESNRKQNSMGLEKMLLNKVCLKVNNTIIIKNKLKTILSLRLYINK